MQLVQPEAVEAAAARIAGIANRTPVMRSRTLDEIVGAEVHLKCESFQRSGSFKFRGAFNAISQLDGEARRRGVLTFSSGNHAQAVALVAQLLGIDATIVMPRSAPQAKRQATEGYGARVVEYDENETSREEVASGIREETGMTLIPPFDHPDVLAGQGTATLELIDDAGPLDLIVTQCGGGGLLSGAALASRLRGNGRVVGIEPEAADDAVRTFHSGTLQTVRNPVTIADGLRTPALGSHTRAVIDEYVDDMQTVTDAQIVEAMKFLWTRMKLVIEPSGAAALAGVMSGSLAAEGQRVGVILSGGNVDLAAVLALISKESDGMDGTR